MTSVIETARRWIRERRAGLFWLIVLIVGIGFVAVASVPLLAERKAAVASTTVYAASGVLVLAIVAHFVYCFTRALPDVRRQAVSRELRSIFVYAYLFQALAIALSLAPFVTATKALSSDQSWAGVAYGCVDTAADKGYGSELTRCGANDSVDVYADAQWLLYIGSRSLPIAARSGQESDERARLSRGLVVPLYVVVLAIVGGAVGMTRRLPELQRQAAYSSRCVKGADAIRPIEAREKVVFQIMQILAAPLIAIVAFSTFEPDTVATAVVAGFASGFASEAILKKLRQASDAVVGKGQ